MSALGAYLLELRTLRNLTLDDLARAIGTSDRVISGWEKGRYSPSVDKLAALVEALGGSLTDVARLVKEDATNDDGLMLARLRNGSHLSLTDEERTLFESLSPQKKQAILTLLRNR
jgi:transcriptional regulator with XRE-family HTH domain